jgi:2,3-bisphosphoglycerate-independent phosphoglycerate mutase
VGTRADAAITEIRRTLRDNIGCFNIGSRSRLVFVHVEAPDEAGHQADASGKVRAVEQIDRHIVGPLLEYLQGLDDWRILVLPDHPTPCSLRTHTSESVPFALAGKRIESVMQRTFTEDSAAAADLHIANGWELMEFFLKVR